MHLLGLVLLFAATCYAVCLSADVVVRNVRTLGQNLGLRSFWLGIMLGLFTSTPEFLVGLQSTIDGSTDLAVGNLLGGTVVLLALVCGLSLVAERTVEVEPAFSRLELVTVACYLLLPLPLAVSGRVGSFAGLVLVGCYLGLLWLFAQGRRGMPTLTLQGDHQNFRLGAGAVAGLAALLVLSRFLVSEAESLAGSLGVPTFMVGLLVLALGTNLPEITIAIRAWRKRAGELSLGNIIGSAIANSFIIGILALLHPIVVPLGRSFTLAALGLVVVVAVFAVAAWSGRRLTRVEGLLLVAVYFSFLFLQLAQA